MKNGILLYKREETTPFIFQTLMKDSKSYELEEVFFCPACKRMISYEDIMAGIPCDCGYQVPIEEDTGEFSLGFHLNMRTMNLVPQPQAIKYGSVWYRSSAEKLEFEFEHLYSSALAFDGRAWLHTIPVYTTVVIDKVKKQAYQLPYVRNGKPVKGLPNTIRNISWTGITDVDYNFNPESVKNTIREIIKKELIVEGESTYKMFKRWKLSSLPQEIAFEVGRGSFDSEVKKKWLILNKAFQEHSFACLPKYMQKRSIVRNISKNPYGFFICQVLWRAGIRDVNIMRTVLEANPTRIGVNSFMYVDVKSLREYAARVSTKDLVTALVRLANSEEVSHQDEIYSNTIADTMEMYHVLAGTGMKISLAGDIRQVHDRLSVMFNEIKKGNLAIPYDETEKRFESREGDIDFTLPADTNTLREIGRTMHICVGSYDSRALRKSCTIVCARRDDDPVACIELDGKLLIQLKASCNRPAKDILQEFTAWAARNGVEYEGCNDYRNALVCAQASSNI